MKKLNKKGFTLIELLAVIVVLAIIMVIATQQVNKTIKKSRRNAFISSYKMILKDVKFKIASEELGEESVKTCDDSSETATQCYTIYDYSKEDYEMKLSESGKRYQLQLTGKGKFQNMDLKSNCPTDVSCGEYTNGQEYISVYIDDEGKVTAN